MYNIVHVKTTKKSKKKLIENQQLFITPSGSKLLKFTYI
jgi:hypothetical protein